MDKQIPEVLLKKYRLGQCTEKEKDLVEQWYNQRAGQIEDYRSDADVSKLKTESLRGIRKAAQVSSNPVKGISTARLIAFSASVAAVLCIGCFLWIRNDSDLLNTFSDKQLVELRAGNGALRKILLPDSSLVILNAGTILSYTKDYNRKNREVTIQEGEVFFDVKHNPSKPFIVTAGRTRTQVLGTAFSVRAYKLLSDIQITVTRGKVAVSNSEHYPEKAATYLLPNDQLSVDRLNGKYDRRVVDAGSLVGWTAGKLHFDNEKLAVIAVLLERKFGVSITIEDHNLSGRSITAKFRPDEGLDEVLENLGLAGSFTYKRVGNQITLSTP